MNTNPLYDPKHWRQRADATRAKAALMAEERTKQKLMRVADEYERLAQRAEQWLARKKDSPSELWLIPEPGRDPGRR